jgi:DNA adenine methylase
MQRSERVPVTEITESNRKPGANGRNALPKPFIKWAGGKGQLVAELLARAPERFSAYHEPFLGGGALFFALQRAGRLAGCRVVLSDANQELIDTYLAIRNQVGQVIELLRAHKARHSSEHFYEVRAQGPEQLRKRVERAARMIYLNKTGFNGLYRVNSKGKFNVPLGRYKNPLICDEPNLRAVAKALQPVEIVRAGFEQVLERAKRGDFVYFDPPYVPVSATANFVAYGKDGFSPQHQLGLAQTFAALAKRRVHVMLSNSDAPDVHTLYGAFQIDTVQARRSVNSRRDRRGPVGELIVLGRAPGGRA